MDVLGVKEKSDSDSKQLNKAMTTLFGSESKSKKTIKEKLDKGLYNIGDSAKTPIF